MAAWKLFGKDVTTEQLPAELRAILAQMQRERVAFETLANTARESAQNLTALAQPITDAQKVVTELQARVKALERLTPVLATLDSPEIRQRFAAGGVNVVTSKTPEDFISFVGAETARWGKVAKESGATID